MRLTLGELLYRFRIQREVESRQVCRGLCSTSAMSYFESGERIPDTLLFECMVERMGVSPEEFSLMVTGEEHVYHTWQEMVYHTIEKEDWEVLENFLQFKVTKRVYCNKKLEKQFYSYAKGIYLASQGDYEKAADMLKIAQKQTIPELTLLQKEAILLSTVELNILILFLCYGVKGQVLDEKAGMDFFHILEQYMYSDVLDTNEQAKCYPKLICVALHCFQKQMSDKDKMYFCEKAIGILRKNKTFHDMTELLRIYIPLLEKYESKELGFYKKQYEVFCDLLESENMEIRFRPEINGARKPKLFMIHEYLSSKRKEHQFTQEKLSEGICEPETYSRVENGKRAPSRKNFKALAERLGIDWCNYRGELDTCELKAYQLRRKQRVADIEGRRQDSLNILEELESYLDMNNMANYQYVKSYKCIAKCRLGLLSAEETYDRLEKLLKQSQSMELDTSYLVYYTQTELEIIGHMAQVLRLQKKYQEGIHLIENVIKQMQHSVLDLEYQWNGFEFLLRVLCGLYFEIGEYDTTIKIGRYVKKVMIRRRAGDNLSTVLDEIADALEHIGEQYSEEYKKLYRQTYYLADYFSIGKVKGFAKKVV